MATMAVFTLLDLTKVFSINSYVYLATLGLVVTLVVAVIASPVRPAQVLRPPRLGAGAHRLQP